MTYQDTLNWMFSQLPMYQRQGKTAFKKDLSNTLKLAEHLSNPETKFKTIHVAGTNGKGSTSHMLASVLQEAGYKVGLYTSPHLKDFRERIKISGKEVSKQFVIGFIKRNKSFFEANNHTQFLGDTLEAIAFEKGGIIKPNIPVVIGETQKETTPVFRSLAKACDSEIVFADMVVFEMYKSDLIGSYQSKNIKTVIQTVKVLLKKGFKISSKNLKQGLLKIVENTGLLGRWQVLCEKPRVICDTGHNREALTYVMQQLSNETFELLHIVFGVVNDKDLSTIVDLLPKKAIYYFCKPNIPRGLDAEELKQIFFRYNLKGEAYNSANEAYMAALNNAKNEDLIFIGGSTFVVAEII